jgi:hypothetical protein
MAPYGASVATAMSATLATSTPRQTHHSQRRLTTPYSPATYRRTALAIVFNCMLLVPS